MQCNIMIDLKGLPVYHSTTLQGTGGRKFTVALNVANVKLQFPFPSLCSPGASRFLRGTLLSGVAPPGLRWEPVSRADL